MIKNMILLVSLIITINFVKSSSFFAPDSDTALLIELLGTTIEQLNELERIVSEQEKLTGKIQKYNEVALDHWYRAQRVAYLVEEITSLKDSKVEDLSDLNSKLRQLKFAISDFKSILIEYQILQSEANKIANNASKDDAQILRDTNMAMIQIKRAHKVKTPANIALVNSQTNAYANKNLVDIKNKNNQILKLIAQQNQHMASEKSEQIVKRMQKQCFYFQLGCQNFNESKKRQYK